MYEIQTKDLYQEISKDIQKKFDTNDYPENHPSEIKTGITKKKLLENSRMKLKVIKYHIYTYILDYYEHKDIKKIIEKHCLMKKKIK